MTYQKSIAAALVATTVLGSVAFAAEQAARPAVTQETSAQKAADKSIGKLSKDGAAAFRDMHLARVAIFEADPTQAKDFVGKAQSALAKAKTDESVFTKEEADLKTSADLAAAKSGGPTPKNASADKKADSNPSAKDQVAWLPVDAQLTLGEDFIATPEKASAVTEANRHLAKGDKTGALEKLRLANVDVDFVMAVLPLDKTTADVNQAATLIGQSKYYEANAILKQAEDRMRFDVIDAVGIPDKGTPTAPKAAN